MEFDLGLLHLLVNNCGNPCILQHWKDPSQYIIFQNFFWTCTHPQQQGFHWAIYSISYSLILRKIQPHVWGSRTSPFDLSQRYVQTGNLHLPLWSRSLGSQIRSGFDKHNILGSIPAAKRNFLISSGFFPIAQNKSCCKYVGVHVSSSGKHLLKPEPDKKH